MSKVTLLNCSKCGHFVGKDGYHDVFYDDYNGGYEVGFPLCVKCLTEARRKAKEEKQASAQQAQP